MNFSIPDFTCLSDEINPLQWVYNCSSTILQTSSTILTKQGFSGGEIMISFFLFMIFLTLFFGFIYFWVSGMKQKKQW